MVRLRLKHGTLMLPDPRTGKVRTIEIRPGRKNQNYEVDVPEAAAKVMLATQQWEQVGPAAPEKPAEPEPAETGDWTGEGEALAGAKPKAQRRG